MTDQINVSKDTRIISAPDDASKLKILDRLFRRVNIPTDDVFLPADNFYVSYEDKDDGLSITAAYIFQWLNIMPKKLTIVYDEIEPAGLYIQKDRHHYIIVNIKYKDDIFATASILAHEIMHYVLLGKFNVQLEDTNDNEKFTDMATIEAGLGILVINGFTYDSGWATTVLGLMFGQLNINQTEMSFGYYKPKQYGKHLYQNIKDLEVGTRVAGSYVLPQSRAFIPVTMKRGLEKPDYVKHNEKLKRKGNLKSAGIILVCVPFAVGFWWFTSGGSGSSSITPEQSAKKLEYDSCVKTAEQYTSDLNATEALMSSAESSGDVDTHNILVPTQNNQAKAVNAQNAKCENIRQQYNNSVN